MPRCSRQGSVTAIQYCSLESLWLFCSPARVTSSSQTSDDRVATEHSMLWNSNPRIYLFMTAVTNHSNNLTVLQLCVCHSFLPPPRALHFPINTLSFQSRAACRPHTDWDSSLEENEERCFDCWQVKKLICLTFLSRTTRGTTQAWLKCTQPSFLCLWFPLGSL